MKIKNEMVKKCLFILVFIGLFSNTASFAIDRSANNDQYAEDGTETTNVVYTEAELVQWFREREYSYAGGQVTLGATIAVTEAFSVYGIGQVVIDTGSYGLVYDGGYISITGLEITGEGVDVPVLDVHNVIQYGYYWEDGWNNVVQNMTVTATGRDGIGGIALCVRQDDGYPVRLDFFKEGLIRSYGTGAVGLYLDAPLDAYCLQIEAEGAGASAVCAPQGANLFYCKLTARGAGASVVSGSDGITLDTCAASPAPQNAQVINRSISAVVGNRLYYPVRQNEGIDYIESYITFLLSGGDEYPAVKQVFCINWQFSSIDTGVLGEIVIQGSLDPPFQGLGLEDDFPLQFVIEVRDPDIPCISTIDFREDEELGAYVNLSFWDTYEGSDESVILWRSDDGGESWYDFTDSSEIEWYGNSICFYYGEITGYVMLQLEASGERSNIVTLYSIDGEVFSGIGGDRDGGDQSGQGKPPGSGLDPEDNNEGNADSTENKDNADGNAADTESNGSGDDIPAMANQNPGTNVEEIGKGETNALSVTMTGSRISLQTRANPENLTFIENGLKVVIPTEAINALSLADEDTFKVYMESDGDSFLIRFFVNELEITGFDGYRFTVYVPYIMEENASLTDVYCYKNPGVEIFAENYEDGMLIFSLDQTGNYTLVNHVRDEKNAALDSELNDNESTDISVDDTAGQGGNSKTLYWLLPVVLIVLAAVAVGILLSVKRHMRGRTPDA